MYYTTREAEEEIDTILNGPYLGRTSGGFYPTGRLRMIQDFRVLFDKGFLSTLQQKAAVFPKELAERIIVFHTGRLADDEDLRRAVAKKDALFYHAALDEGLDNFLIALFTLNGVFFPSRKRNMEAIRGFAVKPEGCESLLADALRYGGTAETLALSFEAWRRLSVWMLKETGVE
jgi:hypothetical protein